MGGHPTSYLLTDALGSVRALTDHTGHVTNTTDYTAFGATSATTGTPGRFGFTGEPTNPTTGHTYLRARDLDPTLGRFLSADTVQPNAPGSQGYNYYTYTANNPTTWTDPTGHVTGLQSPSPAQLRIIGTLVGQAMLNIRYLIAACVRAAVPCAQFGFAFAALTLLCLNYRQECWSIVSEILGLKFDPFNLPSGGFGHSDGKPPPAPDPTPPALGVPEPEPSPAPAVDCTGNNSRGLDRFNRYDATSPYDLYAAGRFGGSPFPRPRDGGADNEEGVVRCGLDDAGRPLGQSTFAERQDLLNSMNNPAKTRVFRLPGGSPLGSDLEVIPDGQNYGGPAPTSHNTIGPTHDMPYVLFKAKVLALPWQPS